MDRHPKHNIWFYIALAILLMGFSKITFAASGCDGAGNCYVYGSATGTGSGASWTNAYTGFGTGSKQVNPGNMQRGVTYWIAAGNYGGVNWSTPDSGSAFITIEAATTANHGPASDWNDNFAGQAVFASAGSSISTDYWTLNGQTRGADWQSGYNIKFWNQNADQGMGVYIGSNHDINFEYIEMEGTGMTGGAFPNNTTADRCNVNNCGVWQDGNIYESSPVSNIYVGYGYYHHTGNSQFWFNVTGNGGSVSSNLTWEYNWVSYNHTGQNGQHDEAYSLLANNATIRYNVFQDISGSGLICDASAANPAMSNWFIYGNLFFNDAAYLALGQNYWLNTVDNGIVALGDGNGSPENWTGTILFTNNTMANYDPPGVAGYNVYSTLPVSGVPGAITGTANVIIENNLWYASAYVYGNYNPICNQLSGTCTEDYNASFQGTSAVAGANWQTNSTPAAHDYNVSGTASPFAGTQPGLTIAAYEPATPDPFVSHAGVTLAAPYNVDMLGVTRGANGTWDRGALQLSGNSNPPNPPTNLTATVQ